MFTPEILKALKGYTANMQSDITFVLAKGEHHKRQELLEFLRSVASVSERIAVEERDAVAGIRSPISFAIEKDGVATGIFFSGIPSGHEFNSLVLAVLQSSGTALKLDSALQTMIKRIDEPLHFEVFVSLSCHNCPDVVQALNQFALLNENIQTEMIDGGLFQDEIKARDIQGVPSVYLNGEVFARGKVDMGELVNQLIEKYPALRQSAGVAESLPVQDVAIIGGGPAGVAAAIYSARKGLKVTLIADRLGGQVKDTMGIENLISVPKTTGPQLTGALKQHIEDYDITVKEHVRVEQISKGDLKKLMLSSGEEITAKALIIATGAKWRELGVPGEKENIGHGVAYCPHCDGPFFKGKDVAVIGGGNSGVEAALDLAGIVKSVTIFEFMPELKADKVLLDQVALRSNIKIKKNVATKQIVAENGHVSAIEYQDRATEDIQSLPLAGVFIQIGLVPNSAFLKGLVELTKYGEVVVNDRCQTSESGVFACGDVTTVPYKQIIISMGEGAKAALSAFEYILKHDTSSQRSGGQKQDSAVASVA